MSWHPEKSSAVAALAIAGAFAASLLGAAPAAHATLTLFEGIQGGNTGTDNVLFNCGGASGPALTVQGCVNTTGDPLVNFTGTQNLVTPAMGQARIEAEVGTFNSLQIALDDSSLGFTKLILNIDAADDGTVDFTATDQFGNVFTFEDQELDGNGENFYTLIATAGEIATSFSLTSDVGINDVQQVRLGVAQIDQVPEPASLALLGSALIGFGILRRRKRA